MGHLFEVSFSCYGSQISKTFFQIFNTLFDLLCPSDINMKRKVITNPPPRMFATANIPPIFCTNINLETLKLGVMEILKPP